TEAASELLGMKTQLEALQLKSSGNAVRAAEISKQNEMAAHVARIAQLEAMVADREDVLRRKEEEIRRLVRNRGMETRSSSVPRSPRPGGSRAGSPVPGGFGIGVGSLNAVFASGQVAQGRQGHPLRNNHVGDG